MLWKFPNKLRSSQKPAVRRPCHSSRSATFGDGGLCAQSARSKRSPVQPETYAAKTLCNAASLVAVVGASNADLISMS